MKSKYMGFRIPKIRQIFKHFARVYVTIEFSFERGGMSHLAYIGATVLNFGPAWPADVCAPKHKQKLKNVAHM